MRSFLYISLFVLLATSFSFPDIRYVSKTGSSTPPFLTWETASDSIQKAIDICNLGDTVIVANGVYSERIIIDKTINLWGSSIDSTIIKKGSSEEDLITFSNNYSTIKNVRVIGPGKNVIGLAGIYVEDSRINIYNCRIEQIQDCIIPMDATVIVENCLMNDFLSFIHEFGVMDTSRSIFRNNIMLSKSSNSSMAYFQYGFPTFINNIVIEEGNNNSGLRCYLIRGMIIKNNLFSGNKKYQVFIDQVRSDSVYIVNNTFLYTGSSDAWAAIAADGGGSRTLVKNNIFAHNMFAIEGTNWNSPIKADYNLFWHLSQISRGYVTLLDSNIVADPMFVHDTIPTRLGNYDFHLQKYSPAIDRGDPSILDADGISRSDIGMYGGPGAEEYTYMDYAPSSPKNVSAVVDSENIILKWNKNSEADTLYYHVYLDTISNYQIDSTKIIATTKDTAFILIAPNLNKHYYFKLTCIDKQYNQSLPSEELHIYITSVKEETTQILSDYILYQNYPNPFNPNTKISYRLKEKGFVKLTLYNITGEIVKELINKEQEQGYYEMNFDGSGLSSGVYIYRIEVTNDEKIPVYSDMKKIILLK